MIFHSPWMFLYWWVAHAICHLRTVDVIFQWQRLPGPLPCECVYTFRFVVLNKLNYKLRILMLIKPFDTFAYSCCRRRSSTHVSLKQGNMIISIEIDKQYRHVLRFGWHWFRPSSQIFTIIFHRDIFIHATNHIGRLSRIMECKWFSYLYVQLVWLCIE